MEPLRETALLGTDKKALDIQHLPEPVRRMLRETAAPDAEWQFLEANALHHFYETAGRFPAKLSGVVDETVIAEEMSIAPKELTDIFARIESVDHQLKESALALWLDVLIEKKLIVSADRLVELIHAGRTVSNQVKEKIMSVIGQKGKWILKNDPTLSYAVAPVGDRIWSEGSMHERKSMFAAMRKTNPEQAMALLRSTWSTESIVNKKIFLELIKQTCTPSDLPFLEDLYGEFQYQPKEKKTEKECRRLVVSMLLQYDTTQLFKTTAAHLLKYTIKPKKGIAGFVAGQGTGSFRIPDGEDDFWNTKTMEAVYGFEVKNYDIAVFSTIVQFWLSSFLENLPFNFWVNAFESDYKRASQFWLLDKTTISGQSVPIFLQALVNNAQELNDHELALAIVQSQRAELVLPLIRVMSPKDFESFIIKNNYLGDVQLLASGPFGNDHSWSMSFSEAVINHAFKLSEQNNASAPLGKVIAQYAHHNSIDILYQVNNKARDTSAYHNWNTAIFQIVHPMLEIRNKIHALKK